MDDDALKIKQRRAAREDIELVFDLFEGAVMHGPRNLPQQEFLQGFDEKEALDILARMLRSEAPLDRQIRLLLAGHLDGKAYNFETRGGGRAIKQQLVPQRRLKFVSPRGRMRQDQKTLKIGAEVLRLLDENPKLQVKAAIEKIGVKYDLSEDRVTDAWEHVNKRGWKRIRPQRSLKLPPVK